MEVRLPSDHILSKNRGEVARRQRLTRVWTSPQPTSAQVKTCFLSYRLGYRYSMLIITPFENTALPTQKPRTPTYRPRYHRGLLWISPLNQHCLSSVHKKNKTEHKYAQARNRTGGPSNRPEAWKPDGNDGFYH